MPQKKPATAPTDLKTDKKPVTAPDETEKSVRFPDIEQRPSTEVNTRPKRPVRGEHAAERQALMAKSTLKPKTAARQQTGRYANVEILDGVEPDEANDEDKEFGSRDVSNRPQWK